MNLPELTLLQTPLATVLLKTGERLFDPGQRISYLRNFYPAPPTPTLLRFLNLHIIACKITYYTVYI